jgi:hypothetical protein
LLANPFLLHIACAPSRNFSQEPNLRNNVGQNLLLGGHPFGCQCHIVPELPKQNWKTQQSTPQHLGQQQFHDPHKNPTPAMAY